MISSQKTAVFNSFFYPKSIAIVGVSADGRGFGSGQLRTLINYGYNGKLYPVNPNGGVISGLKAYTSIRGIPDNVDLAIICVPARSVASR